MANIRSSLQLLILSLLVGGVSAQAQNFELELSEDAQAITDPVAIEDPIAIPRFEDAAIQRPTIVAQPVVPEDVEAVALPSELIGDASKKEEDISKLVEDATVEEAVAEEESIMKKMAGVASHAPIEASAIRAKSEPAVPTAPSARLTDAMTRTEARTFTFTIPAPRGQLLDRNGLPLAQSKVAYYAAIGFPFLGKGVTDEEIERYAGSRIAFVNQALGTKWDLSGKIVVDHYKHRRWSPLMFSAVLNEEQVEKLQAANLEGLKLHPVYVRHYPQQQTLSHVIGHMGKRPPRARGPILNDEPLWREGEGVLGLERSFETTLRGQPGRVNVLYNGDGTKIEEEVLSKPRPGHNVVTSIDLEMQNICERLLRQKVKRGAMVIMDVRNGDVVAMASNPQFNPNDFIPSISQEKFTELTSDPDKPLFPRAFRAAYPPASTFKVPVALGFLESGYVSASDLYPCPNAWRVGDLIMRNWNSKGEGNMNVTTALTRSCNTWFYEVAIYAGGDSMSAMAHRVGLGQKTGLPLNEVEGFIPTNRWWLDKYGHMMSDGDEAVMSIGQGTVETTPIQIARMMAAIGNGREVVKPRLVLQIQDMNHEIVRSYPKEVLNQLGVDGYSLRTVQRGMYNVVNAGNGTAKQAYHKITVSGKTGTGQWKPAQKQNLAWFAGYFPSKYPVYSFAVIYEGEPGENVSGGKSAAPVVGAFLKEYLTEENYNRIRDAAGLLKEADPGDLDQYSYRESQSGSIFRSNPERAAPAEQQAAQPVQPVQPQAAPPKKQGGFFNRIFKRKNR